MKLREKVMSALGEFVVRYYKIILPLGLVLAVAAFFGAGQIKIKTQIKDMMNPENHRVKSYDEISEVFGSGKLLLTVEGKDKSRMAQAAEELAAKVQKRPEVSPYLRSMNLKMDKDFLSSWALMLQKPKDLRKSRKMFSRTNLLPFLRSVNDNLEQTYTGDEAEEDLETGKQENDAVTYMSKIESFTEKITDFVTHPDARGTDEAARDLADTILFGDLYMYSPDGTILLFAVNTTINLSKNMRAADAVMVGVKAAIAEVKGKYPGLTFGYTGDIGVEADEGEAISNDMTVPSFLAYGLVLVLFLFSFTQIRAIVFAMVSLVIGILYNYGIVGVTLGEINLMTSVGTSLLVGMGIDYGIQVTTSFNSFRDEGLAPEDAIRLTFRKSGIGIMLAAASTSASFLVLMVSTSKGVFQLGLVAGMGILTCFLAMIFVLPSMLLWFGKHGKTKTRIPQINWRALEAVGNFSAQHRVPVLVVSAVLTAGLFIASFGLKGQFNILELEPQKAVSIITHRRILDKFGMNALSASVMSKSLEETSTMTDALEDIPRVSQVESVTTLLPVAEEQKARLAEIALFRQSTNRVSRTVFTEKELGQFCREIQRLEWNMTELGDVSVAGLGENNKILKKRNEMVREFMGAEAGRSGKEVFRKLIDVLNADPKASVERLAALDAPFARAMSEKIDALSAVTRHISVRDLPAYLADTYFDKTRTYNLITIYPRAGAMDEETGLRRFDAAMHRISPSITGLVPISLAFFDELFAESKKTAVLVGVLVLIIAFITFRSLRDTLVAAVPVIVSLIMLFGTVSLLGWKINAMNLITLPLNIGIGIAYGTYMIQRFLLEDRNLDNTLKYTIKAIFLSAITTVFGFGSLGLAGSFKMISSFGSVLAIGITFCFLTTLIILPALLGHRKTADHVSANIRHAVVAKGVSQ